MGSVGPEFDSQRSHFTSDGATRRAKRVARAVCRAYTGERRTSRVRLSAVPLPPFYFVGFPREPSARCGNRSSQKSGPKRAARLASLASRDDPLERRASLAGSVRGWCYSLSRRSLEVGPAPWTPPYRLRRSASGPETRTHRSCGKNGRGNGTASRQEGVGGEGNPPTGGMRPTPNRKGPM